MQNLLINDILILFKNEEDYEGRLTKLETACGVYVLALLKLALMKEMKKTKSEPSGRIYHTPAINAIRRRNDIKSAQAYDEIIRIVERTEETMKLTKSDDILNDIYKRAIKQRRKKMNKKCDVVNNRKTTSQD